MKILIKQWGMEPTCASDGEKALEALVTARDEKDPYRLILTDMHMPKMDGFGLVEEIKRHTDLSTSTIMMLTSGGQQGDAALRRAGHFGLSSQAGAQVELREAITASSALPSPPEPHT